MSHRGKQRALALGVWLALGASSVRAAAPKPRGPHRAFRVEWITVRAYAGVMALASVSEGDEHTGYHLSPGGHLGVSLSLFTLRWTHVYWEMVRVGVGARTYRVERDQDDLLDYSEVGGEPLSDRRFAAELIWGSAVGYPIALDAAGHHELRLGVHFTCMQTKWPSYSGFQLVYQYRARSGVRIQLGLLQTTAPFGVVALLGIGP